MRIIDNETGQVYETRQTFNGLNATDDAGVPDAHQLANFFGVPVKWVIIGGIVLLVLPALFGKR